MPYMSTATPRFFSPFAIAREVLVLPDAVKRAAIVLGITPAYEQNGTPFYAEADRDRIAESLLAEQAKPRQTAALSARRK